MPRVEFNEKNFNNCQCPNCPVQANSICAKERIEKTNNDDDFTEVKTEDAAQVYCSIGQSPCSDLEGNLTCICPTCTVWEENNLSNYHYCINGSADDLG